MEETEAALKWRRLVEEQAESGKNVAEYCRERGVSRDMFFRWRKRLQGPVARGGSGVRRDGFIEVRCPEEGERVLRVKTPQGYRMEIPVKDQESCEGLALRMLAELR